MKTPQEILAAAQSLSPAERLQLVEAIWDSLLDTPEAIPMPDWHREVLDERDAPRVCSARRCDRLMR